MNIGTKIAVLISRLLITALVLIGTLYGYCEADEVVHLAQSAAAPFEGELVPVPMFRQYIVLQTQLQSCTDARTQDRTELEHRVQQALSTQANVVAPSIHWSFWPGVIVGAGIIVGAAIALRSL